MLWLIVFIIKKQTKYIPLEGGTIEQIMKKQRILGSNTLTAEFLKTEVGSLESREPLDHDLGDLSSSFMILRVLTTKFHYCE